MSDERDMIQLALQKNNKTYLFSSLGTVIVKKSIAKGESPMAIKAISLVEADNQLFVFPEGLENIVQLISGNYVIHDYQEKSFEGYVTKGKDNIYTSTYKNEPSEKIGESILTGNIQIKNSNNSKPLNIAWKTNTSSQEKQALQNCILRSITIRLHAPGRISLVNKDFIMIDLQTILDFYNNKAKLNYNAEEKILYIIQ